MTLYIWPPISVNTTGLATEATLADIETAVGNILLAMAASVGVERTVANAPYARDYSVSNISDAAWSEIVASTGARIRKMHIFDSSGAQVKLAMGAAGAESEVFRIEPGGPGGVELVIPVNTRLSVRAASGTISTGDLVINFLT